MRHLKSLNSCLTQGGVKEYFILELALFISYRQTLVQVIRKMRFSVFILYKHFVSDDPVMIARFYLEGLVILANKNFQVLLQKTASYTPLSTEVVH